MLKERCFTQKTHNPKNPAIIFIPGWTSDETGYKPRAEALIKLGYICLTISLRGHGESFGKMEDFSRADYIQDAIAAYDFLVKQKEVDTNIIDLVQDREEDFFQDIQPEQGNFALTGAHTAKKVLLIESEHDQIIPHKIFELYKEAVTDKTKLTHETIKDADHQLSKEKWKQEFIDILVHWFKKNH